MDPITINIFGIPGYILLWVMALIAFGLFGKKLCAFTLQTIHTKGLEQ